MDNARIVQALTDRGYSASKSQMALKYTQYLYNRLQTVFERYMNPCDIESDFYETIQTQLQDNTYIIISDMFVIKSELQYNDTRRLFVMYKNEVIVFYLNKSGEYVNYACLKFSMFGQDLFDLIEL